MNYIHLAVNYEEKLFFKFGRSCLSFTILVFAGIQTHNIMTRDEYSNFSPTLGKLPRRAIDT